MDKQILKENNISEDPLVDGEGAGVDDGVIEEAGEGVDDGVIEEDGEGVDDGVIGCEGEGEGEGDDFVCLPRTRISTLWPFWQWPGKPLMK